MGAPVRVGKRTIPEGANLVIYTHASDMVKAPQCRYGIDLTRVRDPIGQADFRVTYPHGANETVKKWIKSDDRVAATIHACRMIAASEVGINTAGYCTIQLMDKHGKWISPAVAELVSDALITDGYNVAVIHLSI